MIAARRALIDGEARQRAAAHAEEGFLSREAGLLPLAPPALALPASHRAWDEVAAELPRLLASGGVGRACEGLPLLSAEAEHLAGEGACRAALVLGVLCHAYVRERELARTPLTGRDAIDRFSPNEDGDLPPVLLRPWKEIAARLGRDGHCLSFSDLVLYNWRLLDPAGPRVVDNLRLLVPTVDLPEEQRFYGTFVETHAVLAPAIEGMVRAQEAVVRDDPEALRAELEALYAGLRHIRIETLHRIDPNPSSPGHVDPVVWSRFVAPLAAPVRPGEAGLSGGAAPIFHVLDSFFGRRRFDTKVGRELHELRRWLAPPVRAFVEGLSEVDTAAYVAAAGRSELGGAWRQAFEAYAGDGGWLFAHRLKVYGFMETGFKAGRTQTNGGFSGALQDRAWEKLDAELDDARRERYTAAPVFDLGGALTVIGAQAIQAKAHHIVLSLHGTGLRYTPGDRVAILPRNDDAVVERTLHALGATGEESLELDRIWRQRFAALGDTPAPAAVPLRRFLTHAQLRPIERLLVARLHTLSGAPGLRALLQSDRCDEVELWDLIEALSERFSPKRLWQARPWEQESLARLVEPMRFRVYSIASAPDAEPPETLHLAVRSVRFESPHAGSGDTTARQGVASAFLASLGQATPADGLPLRIVTPTRFRLPADPATPIICFAGGSGIAPFRAFWQARAQAHAAGLAVGPAWLILGCADEVPFLDELRAEVAAGRLRVDVIFSREDARLTTRSTPDGPRLQRIDAPRGYVDRALDEATEETDNPTDSLAFSAERAGASRLRQLVAAGAHLYVCGATRFAATVERAVGAALGDATAWNRLIGQGRCMLDIFTTLAPATAPGLLGDARITLSELARHNDPQAGWWMAIRGQVYDLTTFLNAHPGGDRLLRACAGTDATASYQRVEHHLQPEVHAMLDRFKIGRLRRPDFGGRWGLSLGSTGFASHDLGDIYEAWIAALSMVVELQNGLRNNEAITLRGGAEGRPTWMKARLRLEQLATFDQSLLDALVNETLPRLWAMTVAFFAPGERLGLLEEHLATVRREAPRWPAEQRARLHTLLAREGSADALADAWAGLDRFTGHVDGLLNALKELLIVGAATFERLEGEVADLGGGELLNALLAVPGVLHAYRSGPG